MCADKSIFSLDWNEAIDPPRYDGINDIGIFIKSFELQVPKQHMILGLDVVLKATPTRWWLAQRKGIKYWA
jgi:hypothetical protein